MKRVKELKDLLNRNIYKNMQKENKKTRGRPSGSNSFASIDLKQLNKIFGQDSRIQVGRVWLERVTGLSIESNAPSIQHIIEQRQEIVSSVEMKLSE